MGAASSPQMQRRAMACADGATRQAAAGDERRAAAPPGDSLMQLSNAATKLSQEGEAGAGGAGDGGAAAPDSLTLSMPELLPSQGAELPSQPDIPIPVLAVHGMPPSAPQLIGSPASPGYAPLLLQAVSRPQATAALGLGMTDYSAGAGAPPASASAGPAHSVPGAGRLRRPTRRGPMDEMRQLVRILVKVIPHSISYVSLEEGGGGNRISEEQIKSYLTNVLGEAQLTAALLAVAAALAPCSAAAAADSVPLYFGNGCFWGRQKDYVDTERKVLGRAPEQVTAVVGYAGGKKQGRDGKVCYYYGPPGSVYERLGHAEVVQVQLSRDAAHEELERFADVYFCQFQRTPFGMLRLDPQDMGPGYRNVIGIPGGVRSPLFKVLQARNVHKMELVEGRGNEFVDGRAREGDAINRVYVLDSNELPFNQAEVYHQFHDGIGHPFPAEYKRDQKDALLRSGRIAFTGCPE